MYSKCNINNMEKNVKQCYYNIQENNIEYSIFKGG